MASVCHDEMNSVPVPVSETVDVVVTVVAFVLFGFVVAVVAAFLQPLLHTGRSILAAVVHLDSRSPYSLGPKPQP